MIRALLQPIPAAAAIVFACAASAVLAGGTVKKEIDVAFAPLEAVRPVLEKALTPRGRFVMLANQGAVLVIDAPEGVLAAERALAAADLPPAEVALDFQFVTGLPARRNTITMAQEVPLPVAFAPPRILVGPNGFVTGVVPASPTRFETRNIGVTSTTSGTVHPDGSVTLDIDTEATELEGFVQYGSGVFVAGVAGAVAVPGLAGDPVFFAPFLNAGGVFLPVVATTRIQTSVVVRPRLQAGTVELDLMPRLEVRLEDTAMEPETVDLKQFHTVLRVRNEQVGRLPGFAGAGEEFNRRFLGAKDPESGGVAIVVKVAARAAPAALAGPPAPSSPPPSRAPIPEE